MDWFDKFFFAIGLVIIAAVLTMLGVTSWAIVQLVQHFT